MTTDNVSYLSELHQLLNKYFSLPEIQSLCLELNVDFESIVGEEKPSQIQILLLSLGRNGRLPELVNLAQQQYPSIKWPPVPENLKLPQALVEGDILVPANPHYIYGDMVQGDKIGGDKVGGHKIQAQTYIERQVIVQGGEITDLEQLLPENGKPPYKGLTYFTEADADWFFGREISTAVLINRLHDLNFLAIVGASGSGKSSLVRAGVIPVMKRNKTLADGTVPPLGKWQVKTLSPTAHPLTKLADTLFPKDFAKQAILHEQALDRTSALRGALASQSQPADQKLLLFVDQFEELFTHCKDERQREAFIANLLLTADESCKILITLRADFYVQCLRYEGLRQVLKTAQEPIGAMTSQELAAAILEPADKGNWQFQVGLVEEMLDDVGQEPGALPFLSHALLETWQRRRGRVLTLSGYREAGKVQGAIAQTAEQTYTALTVHEQAIAQRIFLRLTELGEGTQDTRRRVSQRELGDDIEVQTVIQRLADARLLTTTKNGVDVAHEALIRAWPTLRRWLDENREELRLHRQLTEASQIWIEMDRDKSVLYRGAKLIQAQAWATENNALLNRMEQDFLDASVDELEAQAKAARQRTKRIIAGLTIALIIISLMAISAFSQWRATLALQEKILAQELTTRAESFINVDNELALLLALESAKIDPSEERIENTLRRVIKLPTTANVLLMHPGIRSIAFSHDGENLVTAGDDAIARVWSWPTGEQLRVLEGHTGWIVDAEFSPDDRQVITASTDGTARLWDIGTGQVIAILQDPDQPCPKGNTECRVWRARFSPDGKWVITGRSNGSTYLWDALTGRMVTVLPLQQGDITAVDFSPDSRRVVTASKDGTAQLWFIQETQAILLLGHDSWLWQARFSPDGQQILTASLDRTVRIWDGFTGDLIQTLNGHRGSISDSSLTPGILDARFSPDGKVVATVGDDGTARIWDPVTGSIMAMMIGHDDVIFSVTFSPDSHYILTSSNDLTARLWETETGRAIQVYTGIDYKGIHQDYSEINSTSTVFTPDGRHILTSSTEGRLLVLETAGNTASDSLFQDASLEELITLAESKVTRQLTCQERQSYLHETHECP